MVQLCEDKSEGEEGEGECEEGESEEGEGVDAGFAVGL